MVKAVPQPQPRLSPTRATPRSDDPNAANLLTERTVTSKPCSLHGQAPRSLSEYCRSPFQLGIRFHSIPHCGPISATLRPYGIDCWNFIPRDWRNFDYSDRLLAYTEFEPMKFTRMLAKIAHAGA